MEVFAQRVATLRSWTCALGLLAVCLLGWGEDAAAGAVKDRIADVGGARLHFVVRAGQGPVVVFEAGGGGTEEVWTAVMSRLETRTPATLAAYDREGHGQSEALSSPYNIYEEVARLHKGLTQLGLDKDVVLVGHSYGGFLIQLYANLYPTDVHALVYVDANTVIGVGGRDGARKMLDEALAVSAKTPNGGPEKRMVPAFLETVTALEQNPAPCGVPVIVISQGKGDLLGEEPHWFEGHKALVARTGGRAVTAAKSGHMIPLEAPEVVADAVMSALSAPKPQLAPWFAPAQDRCGQRPPP